MAIQIRMARNLASLLEIEKSWDDMVSRYFHSLPFLQHFWFINYYQAFFDRKPILVLTAHEDNQMVAALPMVFIRKSIGGISLKQARFLAGAQSCVKQLPIPKDRQDIIVLFMEELLKENIDLCYFESDGDHLSHSPWLENLALSQRLKYEIWSGQFSPFIVTAGDFSDFSRTLSKKFRELINNRLNKINKAGGYTIKTYRQLSDLPDLLNDIEAISRDSWQGKLGSGLLSNASNSRFYSNLLSHSLGNGYGAVYVLYFADSPAAYEYHITNQKTEYCIKAEYSQQYSNISPGGVLDVELVKRAFASRIEIYDLLGSADGYKLRWTTNLRSYSAYYIFARSLPSYCARLIRFRLPRALKRVKQSKLIGLYARKDPHATRRSE